jgi:CysZ protein
MIHSGPHYLSKGFKLILQPTLRRFVFVPLILNIILFAVIWVGSFHYMSRIIVGMDAALPYWLHFLNFIVWPLFLLLLLLVSAYLFTWIANYIGAPFYGLLSEAVQKHLKGQPLPEGSLSDTLKAAPKMMAREWLKLKYYIPRSVALVVLTWLPGLNIFATPAWFLFGGWMQGMQYLDYPADNNGQAFLEYRAFLSAHRTHTLSFGCSLMVLMMIPVVNIVVMPAAVAGATALWLDEQPKNEQKDTQDA